MTITIKPVDIVRFSISESVGLKGAPNGRMLWFNPLTPGSANTNILPAHEIGHSLGMNHITTKNNAGFLMNPTIQPNNFIIPAETLIELNP